MGARERAVDPVVESKRVLVTGSAGLIGRRVCDALLARGHHVRGFDRVANDRLEDDQIGDLGDRDAIDRAVDGIDCVIHLGAYRNNADFMDVLLEPNVIGMYHVCNAVREARVNRLVLASSVQVLTGLDESQRPHRPEGGAAPTNDYAMTKVWAEVAGEMLARCHGVSVIAVRIGWVPVRPPEMEKLQGSATGLSIFFSHNDAKRFFTLCVESPRPESGEFVILNGASRAASNPYMDLTASREVIGYEPQDDVADGLDWDYPPVRD
jgi:nucleoside-diphosphate-sugar epimerase